MKFHRHIANRRTVFITSITIVTTAFFIAVVFSPLALREFGTSAHINWSQLSNIGQTYGAVSALLTAMALAGVVASLLFQARDVRLTKEQAIRTFHHELIRMQLDDPFYMNALGASGDMAIPAERDKARLNLYVHLWVSFWQTFYAMGMMPESQLRSACKLELFRGRPGRDYWEQARGTRPLYTKDRHVQKFDRILEEEYRKAIASQSEVAPPAANTHQAAKATSGRDKAQLGKAAGTLLMAAATGALVDRVLNRRV
jgi:hypothetical protein